MIPTLFSIRSRAIVRRKSVFPSSPLGVWPGLSFFLALLGPVLAQAPTTAAEPSKVTFPLYGNIYTTAYWFADVYVGRPEPQRQSLIIDTGSSVTGFPCSTCLAQCGVHIDPPFNVFRSQSLSPIPCQNGCVLCAYDDRASNSKLPLSREESFCAFHIEYVEGSSLTGRWYEDKVALGQYDSKSHKFHFNGQSAQVPLGCHSRETQQFRKQYASGILGLEMDSHFGPATFVHSILTSLLQQTLPQNGDSHHVRFHTIPKASAVQPVFSVCLSQNGGILAIGGENQEYHIPQRSLYTTPNQNRGVDASGAPVLAPQGNVTQRFLRRTPYFIPLHESNEESARPSGPPSKFAHLAEQPGEPRPHGLVQWTPMLAMIDQKGHYEGYFILLEEWRMLREDTLLSTSLDSSPVDLPYAEVQKPFEPKFYFTSFLQPKKGLLSLVDSGTTLTYLPFAFYTRFWIQFTQHLLAAKAALPMELSELGNFRRIRGTTIPQLELLGLRLMASLERDPQESPSGGSDDIRRRLSEISDAIDALGSFKVQLTSQLENPLLSPNHVWIRTLVASPMSPLMSPFYTAGKLGPEQSKATHRQLEVIPFDLEEECWEAPPNQDFYRLFPIMRLRFSRNAVYTWEPKAYLYRRGTTNAYCLTITAKDSAEDGVEHDLPSSNTTVAGRQMRRKRGKRRLQETDSSIILGSSFFINHDIIFQLGSWSLGFSGANCPSLEKCNLSSEKRPLF